MSRHLSSHPTSAGAARRFVRDVLESWGCTGHCGDAVLLCADELVTNAIVHVGSDIDVVLRRVDSGVRIEVFDRSPKPPLRQVPRVDAATGRGLSIVEALAQRWGVAAVGEGKAVWCEIGGLGLSA